MPDISPIKDAKKVFVPYFKVSYEKVAHAGGSEDTGNWRGSASAKMHVNVETTGYKEDVFKKITNLAYEDLVYRLKEKGFEVITREDAKSTSKVMQSKLKSSQKDFPKVDDDESVYLAMDTAFPDSWLSPLLPDGSLSMPPSDLLEDLDAAMIVAGYSVGYVSMGVDKNSSFDKASVKISLGSVVNVGGFMQAYTKDGGYKIGTGQVVYSNIPFGHLENSTSAGTKAALVGVAVLGALLSSGDSLDIEDYTLTVDEGKFIEASLDALKKANETFVNAI